jgi:hypothetical protein
MRGSMFGSSQLTCGMMLTFSGRFWRSTMRVDCTDAHVTTGQRMGLLGWRMFQLN